MRAGRGTVPSHGQGCQAQPAPAFASSPVQPSRCFVAALRPELLFFPADHKLCDCRDRICPASCHGTSAREVDTSIRACEALGLGGRWTALWAMEGIHWVRAFSVRARSHPRKHLLSPLPLSRELRTPLGAGFTAGPGWPTPLRWPGSPGPDGCCEDGMCRRYPGGRGCLHLLAAAHWGPPAALGRQRHFYGCL